MKVRVKIVSSSYTSLEESIIGREVDANYSKKFDTYEVEGSLLGGLDNGFLDGFDFAFLPEQVEEIS